MSSEQREQQTLPVLCANGCRFYGNPANHNLCSKCYHEFLSKKEVSSACQNSSSAFPSNSSEKNVSVSSASCVSSNNSVVSSSTTSVVINNNNTSSNVSSKVRTTSSSAATSTQNVVGESSVSLDPSRGSSETAVTNSHSSGLCVTLSDEDATISNLESTSKVKQVNVSKCWKCNKKVGLLGFQCRCGYTFCSDHRHYDTHDCDFDYKTFEREQLRRQNKKVVAEKFERI